jgi:hypothetical protein
MWIHHPNLKKVFRFVAIKEIAPGEEILVFYGDETYWSDGRVSSRTKLV